MTSLISIALAPILLLLAPNAFITFAWYGQLKFPGAALAGGPYQLGHRLL